MKKLIIETRTSSMFQVDIDDILNVSVNECNIKLTVKSRWNGQSKTFTILFASMEEAMAYHKYIVSRISNEEQGENDALSDLVNPISYKEEVEKTDEKETVSSVSEEIKKIDLESKKARFQEDRECHELKLSVVKAAIELIPILLEKFTLKYDISYDGGKSANK